MVRNRNTTSVFSCQTQYILHTLLVFLQGKYTHYIIEHFHVHTHTHTYDRTYGLGPFGDFFKYCFALKST